MIFPVLKTLKALGGEFKFKSTIEEEVATLGPFRFNENNSVYMGQWYQDTVNSILYKSFFNCMRWGKGK